jgi:succinate dehydrogenase/fumarate reductase flavoprotein subunit
MTEEKDKKALSKTGVSRRTFLKTTVGGVAVGAAVLGATASLGLPKTATAAKLPGVPSYWDLSADVVVLGHGFAGQMSAIAAAEAGATVLLLEKAPQKFSGGNSRVCGQGIWTPSSGVLTDAFNYMKAMSAGTGYPVPDDYITAYVNGSHDNMAWFTAHGATMVPDRAPGIWEPFYPMFPGAKGMASETDSYSVTFGKYVGGGRDWYFLEDLIATQPNITCLYNIPATKLIQNPATKEIYGVVASSSGQPVNVRANRAVVIATGGYEFNRDMTRNYIHIPDYAAPGGPYNTGDGIKMGQAVGADLIGMGVYAAPWGRYTRVPQYMSCLSVSTPSKGGVIWVGADWKRYRDEYYNPGQGYTPGGTLASTVAAYPFLASSWSPTNVGSVLENGDFRREKTPFPMWEILDSVAEKSGTLFGGSYAAAIEGYVCSSDNSVELARGYFVSASDIKTLAGLMGTDLLGNPANASVLQAEVNNWNAMCTAGKDTQFGRTTNLTPISTAPFYAINFIPGTLNTQGGLLRNPQGQVLDTTGAVIPRLYGAGENGDRMWANLYECMHNVGAGCMAVGRISGANAAAETPWTS